MAEEEEGGGTGLVSTGVQGAAKLKVAGKRRFGPETDRATRLAIFHAAPKALAEHLKDVIGCILVNIQEGHLPSAVMLWDIVRRVEAMEDVPAEEFESLAEVLWKAYQEQGLGNRE